MSDFYNEMQGIASDILGEFDQGNVSYIEVVPGSGPADDPGAATEIPHAIAAVAKGVSFAYVQGGLAVASDLQLTMAVPPDYVPNMFGFVTIADQRYKIVKVIAIPAAGTPSAYRLIFRS